jgi:hypothetical protein
MSLLKLLHAQFLKKWMIFLTVHSKKHLQVTRDMKFEVKGMISHNYNPLLRN